MSTATAPRFAPSPPPSPPVGLPPLATGPGAEADTAESFGARFRAELANRPLRLAAAFLATVVVPAVVLANVAGGTPPSRTSPAPSGPSAVDGAGTGAWTIDQWTRHAHGAAAACPGLPPEVLVAIGHVETRHGRHLGPSSAGALGPMQFMPATWAAYGTDGNGDGIADVLNPLDALHGAARLLCANGGADPTRLRSALWNYNHSSAYVDEVLTAAGRL